MNREEYRVLCAVCREPLGHIMFPDDPISHQTSPMEWPLRGTIGVAQRDLVHILGEKVHTGRIVESTGLIIGEPGILGLECLENGSSPELRYRGL